MLQKYFALKENNTSVQTEVIAGMSTFLTMSYIIFLNPIILQDGGFDFGGVFTATILSAALACFIMALYGRTWPIGLAPGMGINAFISYSVCKGMGYSPEEALGAVFVAGLVFLVISLTPLRAWIINSIPKSLKFGIGAGIGLFLAVIGLEIMGITVAHPETLITLGNVKDPLVLLACFAFIVMIVLEKLRVQGNIVIGIIAFSIVAWVSGLATFNGVVGSIPPMTLFLKLDIGAALTASMATIVFTLFFIDFFDTAGTLTSVANVAGKIDGEGKIKNVEKAMLSDSVATVTGAVLGTSNVTAYIESAAGVKAGGKTGLTSLVIGILFLLCLFFAPLATSLPKQIDGAALLYVSTLFFRDIAKLDWEDITEYAPALVAMLTIPLTYSISHGIALAFICYVLAKVLCGEFRGVSPAIWLIAALSLLNFWVI